LRENHWPYLAAPVFPQEPGGYRQCPARINHVVDKKDWPTRNGLAIERERAINVARLLYAVRHRFLFGPLIRLGNDRVEWQTQRDRQALRKTRRQIGMP
jgi:hypothetical protein